MLKKTMAIVVSLAMLITIMPTMLVSAALPTTGFTRTKTNYENDTITGGTTGYAVDNFDNATIDNNSPYSYASYNDSPIFAEQTGMYSYRYSIANATETDRVIRLASRKDGNNVLLTTSKFTVEQGYRYVLEYDVRFTTLEPGHPAPIHLGERLNTTYGSAVKVAWNETRNAYVMTYGAFGGNGSVDVEKDKWYRIRTEIYEGGKSRIYATDAETGKILVYSDSAGATHYAPSGTRGTPYFTAVRIEKQTTANADLVKLDVNNAEMAVYKEADFAPSVKANSIADKNYTLISDTSATITFDQPIATAGTATLTVPGGEEINCTVTKDSTRVSTYIVSWGKVLAGGTGYKLTLANFKNAGNAAGNGEITFNVSAAPKLSSSSIVNGVENVSVSTKSLTLTFDQEVSAPENVVIKGGAEDITASVEGSGADYTVAWTEELEGNTQYTIDFSAFSSNVACSDTLTFKTENTAMVIVSDDFEVDGVSEYGYNVNNEKQVALTTGGPYASGYITRVTGYNGAGNALQLKTGGSKSAGCISSLRTVETLDPAEKVIDGATNYEKFVVTYRFNLKQLASFGEQSYFRGSSTTEETTTGADIYFYADDAEWRVTNTIAGIKSDEKGAYIYKPYEANYNTTKYIDEDHWYNIVWTIDGADQTFTLIDAEGEDKGETVWITDKTVTSYSAGSALYIVPCYAIRSSENGIKNENQTILLDDFKVTRIKPWLSNHKLSVQTDEAVSDFTLDGELEMSFNQPVVAKTGAVVLYEERAVGSAGALENTEALSLVSYKYPDFNEMTVSFSNLDYSSDYTVDYSNLVSSGEADLGNAKVSALIDVSTVADPRDMSISNIACEGLNKGNKVTFDLSSKDSTGAVALVAFYKRSFPAELEGVEMENINISAGANDVEITLENSHEADYVKVFVWDGMDTLVPLTEAYEVNAPVETLDVLLIGNSLSEDAGRYLHDVAEKDGITLNVTVRGIGGSTLNHHADNLKAELAGRTVEEAATGMEEGTLDRALYFNYENGVYEEPDATNQRLLDALKEKQYDIISLQQFSTGYSDEGFSETLPYLTTEIRKLQPNAEIVLYQTWSPMYGIQEARNYYFENTIEPSLGKWAAYTGQNVENITLNGNPIKIVSVGKAFHTADNKYSWCRTPYTSGEGGTGSAAQNEVIQRLNAATGLWRDYNHASYYGCYLADAVWYECLTGRKASVGTKEDPAVKAPVGISAEEHIERLNQLSDTAHLVVLEQNK